MDVENKQRRKDKLGYWDWNIQTIMHHPARCLVPDRQCRGTADSIEHPGWSISLPLFKIWTQGWLWVHGWCQHVHCHRDFCSHDPYLCHGYVRRIQATRRLDHPILLLPDLWFCPQHLGCGHRTCLSKLHPGIYMTAASWFSLQRWYHVSESYLFGPHYSSVHQHYLGF